LMSFLAVSTILASAVSQARAGYTLDLRVTGGPTAATNGGKLVTNPAAGDYTVELWSQISGNTTFTDDSWTNASYSLASNVGVGSPNNSFSGAGTGITAVSIPAVWDNSVVQSSATITNDSVQDWGNASNAVGTSQILSGAFSAQAGGGSLGHQVNANTWEVLLATITVHVGGLVAQDAVDHQTTFNVISPLGGAFQWSGIGKVHPFNATIDGVTASGTGTSLTSTTLTINSPVVFDIPSAVLTPEPASLGMLSLGGLALLARRRKNA